MKKVLFTLGVLLSLGLFSACSSSNDVPDLEGQNSISGTHEGNDSNDGLIEAEGILANHCFDGRFIMERIDGRIVVALDEVPVEDELSRFGLCYVAFKKTDLPEREYKDGDHIFFKIKRYSKEYEGETLELHWGISVRFTCIVEPC